MDEDATEERLLCRRRGGMCEGYSITTGKPPISNANVLKLAAAFGLKDSCIFAYNHGYRNHSFGVMSSAPTPSAPGKTASSRPEKRQKYNLMLLKNELNALERVQNADKVAEIAHLAGMPVRTLASPKTLKIASGDKYRFARLYHWLEGDTIPWEAYTRKHLRTLGKTLAELHRALAAAPQPPLSLSDALAELEGQNTQMHIYFARSGVKNALQRKLGLKTCQNHQKIADFLASVELQNLPRQPLHLDFVRGNILWAKESETGCERPKGCSAEHPVFALTPKISGIIDFEKTANGSPLIDLARTYAFLLVDCPKTKADIQRYFLHGGYFRFSENNLLGEQCWGELAVGQEGVPERPGRSCEKSSYFLKTLEAFVGFYLLFDFYKFLSHNPYESLAKNYHFCRTRDILKERKLLEEI
jgi:Ser/Thr protein kinase RdoA (MazF antagonist)